MTDSGTYRDRWVAEVFRTHLITDTTRVTLLALTVDMDDDGFVELRRDDLADRLGRSGRRIGERFSAAIDAGFLMRISRGQRNGGSRYRAVLPGRASSGRPGVPKSGGLLRTPGGPEDGSLEDGFKPQENSSLEDPRGSRRDAPDPRLLRTPGGPAENRAPNKDRARAHSKRSPQPQTDSDHASGGEVIHLFGEEKDQTIPPPAGAAAPDDEPKPITAQTVVAAYVDGVREAIGEGPTRRLVGQIAKQAKELISDEGRDPARLVVAAHSLGTKVERGFSDLGREYLMTAQRTSSPAAGTDPSGRAPWANPNYADEEYLHGTF